MVIVVALLGMWAIDKSPVWKCKWGIKDYANTFATAEMHEVFIPKKGTMHSDCMVINKQKT